MKRVSLLLPLALGACSYDYVIERDEASSTTGTTTGTTTGATSPTTTTGTAPGSGGSGAGDEGGGGSGTVTTTSGDGGAGGQGAGDGGSGGAGGGEVECIVGDCPQPEGECQIATCEDDGTGRLACGIADRPDGTPVGAQVPGDCEVRACVGGVPTEGVPADDPPADAGCLTYSCDGAGTVVSTPVAVGTPCAGGVCQTGIYAGQCGLSLYARPFPGAGSWTRQALSAVWTGANAPPPTDILVAEEMTDGARLVVIRADGTYYELSGGAWQAPQAASAVFPDLPSTSVSALAMGRVDANEILIFTTSENPPRTVQYQLTNGVGAPQKTYGPATMDPDDVPNAAPQHDTTMTWGIGEQRAPFGSTPDSHVTWKSLESVVYEFWSGSEGFSYPNAPVIESGSPFGLNGVSNAPLAGTIVAAFYRNATNTAFFIAP